MQALLIMTLVAEKAYELFVAMGSSMIMVPYLLSAVYYMKLSMGKERSLVASGTNITGARIFAFLGTVYGIWMLYAGGLDFFLLTAILYVPGHSCILYRLERKKATRERSDIMRKP